MLRAPSELGIGAAARGGAFLVAQQTLVSRPRSACIAFSSCRAASVWQRDLRGSDVRRHHNPVVHPLAFTPRRHHPGAAQIGKVAGNLLEDAKEEAVKAVLAYLRA